ncbi:DUF6387 family protein [Enterobacter mori]|uniref:DUF6387 family protein n=1 Tax=Enterobacter mori TaxID=539813 RepID=UPI00398ACE44
MSYFIDAMSRLKYSPEKYDALDSLSDYDLILQLKARETISSWVDKALAFDEKNLAETRGYEIPSEFTIDLPESLKIKIFSGQDEPISLKDESLCNLAILYALLFQSPLEVEHFEKYFSHYERLLVKDQRSTVHDGLVEKMLPYTDHIKALSRWDIECCMYKKASSGIGSGERLLLTEEELENMEEEKLHQMSTESINFVIDNQMISTDFKSEMLLKLDLECNDEELLSNLKELLPIWRSKLGLNKPEKKRDWNYMRSKIIKYKIIPFYDAITFAKLWSHLMEKRVTKKDLSLVVYHGLRDGFGIDQTVLPFLEKIRGKSSQFIADYKISK